MSLKKIFTFTLLFFLVQTALFGGTTGKIAGKVTDENGEPVPYANVILEGTEIGAQTKENGTYIIINIDPGTYNVVCQRGGFKPAKVTGVQISLDITTIQNIKISRTAVQIDDFDVSEARVEMVQASKTGSGRTIKAEDMELAPVDNLGDVIALQAGVSISGGELHFRGGRSNEVVYTIDGMSVSDAVDGGSALTVDMDAVEYTDVKTGGFTAEYGNAQSGIINITTKSGGRDYHGKFELITDHAVTDVNSSNSDQLKFNIGGPVFTPWISSLRDKFTFFANVAGSWTDGRFKDYFYSDPVAEIEGLVEPDNFTYSNPNEARDDFFGFDLGNRNYNDYNANVKLKYQINAAQKLTIAVRGDRSKYKSFAYGWKYALEHYNAGETFQHQIAGTYDHTFNPQMNLKIKASYYSKQITQGPDGISRDQFFIKTMTNDEFITNDDYLHADNQSNNIIGVDYLTSEVAGLVNGSAPYWELPSFSVNNYGVPFTRPGSISGFYADDENSVLTLRTDFEYQLNQIHGFKTGLEVTKHHILKDRWSNPWDIDVTRYNAYLAEFGNPVEYAYTTSDTIFFSDLELELPTVSDTAFVKNVYDLNDLYNAIIAAAGDTEGYEAFPWQAAFYLQDKMEWEGMIVNAGVRLDGWYLGEEYKILQDAGNYVWEPFEEKDKYQLMISPRLGVSHPISETAVMHFAYNYQNQLPQMQYIFTTDRPEDAITSSSAVVVGKPNLEPQITITYEVGLQKQLSEDYVMDIQAYYKNIYNYVSTRIVYDQVDDNVSWYEYYSNDYGSARGIDFNLEKRLSNYIMGSTSYSLAWANGNNSATVIQNEATNLREFPLDWDMRHNYSLNFTFRISRGEEFYIPFTDFMLPTFLTDDFSTSFGYNIASGTPYTPSTIDGTSFDTNSALQPYTEFANMRITKSIYFNEDISIRAYLSINNLFNKENVNWVYSITGSPYDNGNLHFVDDEQGGYYADTDGEAVLTEQAGNIYMDSIRNPTATSNGRTFSMGFAFKF
ncbi:MAG: TonB-dependent receptor [Candidatus Cloacimonetes bacterium]|jgi:outer membrane receptor protein involved in Fe transport|nr:TonB-dependent receptor [Candidatus Cloacimonadota bacterium]MBT6993719.1 TonB-dependent receptor [Candidatus Cloacimonadota bacterium]MBT7469376.1 TonB-dependent receptor [Candidatus Cloacimonadota bacterium]